VLECSRDSLPCDALLSYSAYLKLLRLMGFVCGMHDALATGVILARTVAARECWMKHLHPGNLPSRKSRMTCDVDPRLSQRSRELSPFDECVYPGNGLRRTLDRERLPDQADDAGPCVHVIGSHAKTGSRRARMVRSNFYR